MKTRTKIYLAGTALILSGCAVSGPALNGQLDPNLGAAIKTNTLAQAVAPTPEQKANTFIPANPARTALAREKYRENKVPEPKSVNSN